MLKKNRLSAFIMSAVFVTAALAAYMGVLYLYQPGPEPAVPAGYILYLALPYGLIIFFISRDSMVMGLSEAEGFGLRGLLRWFACGAMIGAFLSVWLEILAPLLGLKSSMTSIFKIIGPLAALFIGYSVVFRRSPFFAAPGSVSTSKEPPRYLTWFLIIGGSVALAGCWFLALENLGRNPGLYWMSLVGVCMSLEALLLGVLVRPGRRSGVEKLLFWVMPALIILALVLFTVGLLA